MKGIVFTEFLQMVESKHGYELVDFMLTQQGLKSGGIYTAVGTYDANEMFILISAYTARTNEKASKVLNDFGQHLFGVFREKYPKMINESGNAFAFLNSIEGYIHVEVRKIYPEAELPTFIVSRPDEKSLEMIYKSKRKMADLAYGLIVASLTHFGETAKVSKTDLKIDGSEVKFLIEIQ